MASDPTVKKIQLTGGAAATFGGGEDTEPPAEGSGTRKKGRGRRSAAKTFKVSSVTKEGGGSTSPGTMDQLSASRVPATEDAGPVTSVLPKSIESAGPAKGGAPAAAAKPMKVVLAAAKKKKGKVILAAAKTAAGATATPAATPSKTRKAGHGVRKIRVSMSGLSKKINRAKTIRKEASEATLEQIKKALHKAGLIKADSKAPETILRQMYADFMMLKSRAL